MNAAFQRAIHEPSISTQGVVALSFDRLILLLFKQHSSHFSAKNGSTTSYKRNGIVQVTVRRRCEVKLGHHARRLSPFPRRIGTHSSVNPSVATTSQEDRSLSSVVVVVVVIVVVVVVVVVVIVIPCHRW